MKHTHDNRYDWLEAEHRAAFIADQQRWECHMLRDAGCQPTTHYVDETGRVLLGEKTIADAQYADDERKGGLVSMALNR